jgi:molecular chaperone GrpE
LIVPKRESVKEKASMDDTGRSAASEDEKASRNNPAESPETEQNTEPSASTEGEGADDVEKLRAELERERERTLRAQAELENYRRRSNREMEDTLRYAAAPVLRDLLPVLDNMDRSIDAAERASDAAGLLEGFKMVAKQLEEVLQRHYCTRIDSQGEPFDPNMHEAISQRLTDECEPNTVVDIAQDGYRLHERVLRPSQVIVAIPPSEE